MYEYIHWHVHGACVVINVHKLDLSVFHVTLKDWIEVVNIGSKSHYPQNHLPDPFI